MPNVARDIKDYPIWHRRVDEMNRWLERNLFGNNIFMFGFELVQRGAAKREKCLFGQEDGHAISNGILKATLLCEQVVAVGRESQR